MQVQDSPQHECITECDHKLLKLEAHGKSALFLNPQQANHRKYEVDGCLVKNSLAADCALEKTGTGLVIVEFKGRNVEHATKQLSASYTYFKQEQKYDGKIAALVVSTESPSGSATLNRLRDKFARQHQGCPLHVHSSAKTKTVEQLLRHG